MAEYSSVVEASPRKYAKPQIAEMVEDGLWLRIKAHLNEYPNEAENTDAYATRFSIASLQSRLGNV